MGAKRKIQANRKSIRAPVVPTQIKGLLTREGSNEAQLPFLVWDVSESGIGLWCSDELHNGDRVKVTVGQPYLLVIEGEVRWVEKGEDGGYRCGVDVKNPNRQLQSLYETFCKIMEEHAKSKH